MITTLERSVSFSKGFFYTNLIDKKAALDPREGWQGVWSHSRFTWKASL